jgi:hypothetical protein
MDGLSVPHNVSRRLPPLHVRLFKKNREVFRREFFEGGGNQSADLGGKRKRYLDRLSEKHGLGELPLFCGAQIKVPVPIIMDIRIKIP